MVQTLNGRSNWEALFSSLDRAVATEGLQQTVRSIEGTLRRHLRAGGLQLPAEWVEPSEPDYARRLLHRDLERGYSVVLMVWGPGQGTPLHDHDGRWCVEGVVSGRIRVRRYELRERVGGRFRFAPEESVEAGVGTAGTLVPPAEHHVLENALADEPSVTVHVYQGELIRCRTFELLEDGWYRAREQSLGYTD